MSAAAFQRGFTSLNQEMSCDDLPIHGALPAWLNGVLLRNGPARFDFSAAPIAHWFDGLAMLHAFTFTNGRVAYANRFLRSRSYRTALQTGKLSFSAFTADPCGSIFGRLFTLMFPYHADNANIGIARVGKHFLAMTETPLPVEFDPQTLKTIGLFNYADQMPGTLTTAHPLYDAARAASFNYITSFGATHRYQIYRTSGTRRELVAARPVKEPAYMHSFGMSENYVILSEFPFVVNPLKLLLGDKPFIAGFEWKPEREARFLVFDKNRGGRPAIYATDPFFAFHHVNAFEVDGTLVVDLLAYPDPTIIDRLYLDSVKRAEDLQPGQLRRYHLPLDGTPGRMQILSATGMELPQINERYRSRPYQFAYGVGTSRSDDFLNQLVKIDVSSGQAVIWAEAGCYPGEPVFVARPEAAAEDDGVILSVVLDARSGASFLLVLDAAAFTEIGRALAPHHIPFGFHGGFFDDLEPAGATD